MNINTTAKAAAYILFTQMSLENSCNTRLAMIECEAAWTKSRRELLHSCMDIMHQIYDQIYDGYTQAAKENRDKNGHDKTYELLKRTAKVMPNLRYAHEPIFENAIDQLQSMATIFLNLEELKDE